MMTRTPFAVCAVALTCLCSAVPAGASLLTYDVSFAASNYQTGAGFPQDQTPPVLAISGDFHVNFDSTQAYVEDTKDITEISFSPASFVQSNWAFNWYPQNSGGLMEIYSSNMWEGISLGVNGFIVFMSDIARGQPTYDQSQYTATGFDSLALTNTGTMSYTAVPEPDLCLLSVAAAGALLRCRFSNPVLSRPRC
jgi:hypothetical protein